MADSGKSVTRIGGNTGQMADMGESVIRIGGNTGQMADICLLYTSDAADE